RLADQPDAAAVRIRHVDHREWHVARIGRQRFGSAIAGLLRGAGIGRTRGQLAQQGKLALADDAARVIAVGADDAAHAAVIVRDRAVREGVVRLLRIAIALHDQKLRFDERPLVTAHGGVQHWTDLTPDFAPDLLCRTAQRPRMPAANNRLVWIIV